MNNMLIRPGLFLLALLCFLLPFTRISCEKMPYVHLSGVDLAFGTKIDSSKLEPQFLEELRKDELKKHHDGSKTEDKAEKMDLQPYVLAAFIAVALSMLLSLILKRKLGGLLAGITGAGAIALLLYYQYYAYGEDAKSTLVRTETTFLYGYWLTIGFLALATAVSFISAAIKPPIQPSDASLSIPPPIHEGDAMPGTDMENTED